MAAPFLTAQDARSGSRNNIVIFNETRDIEHQILLAVNSGLLTTTVTNTTFTTNHAYYSSWQKTQPNQTLDDQMKQVVNYFTLLGYNIAQIENADSPGLFNWVIAW